MIIFWGTITNSIIEINKLERFAHTNWVANLGFESRNLFPVWCCKLGIQAHFNRCHLVLNILALTRNFLLKFFSFKGKQYQRISFTEPMKRHTVGLAAGRATFIALQSIWKVKGLRRNIALGLPLWFLIECICLFVWW